MKTGRRQGTVPCLVEYTYNADGIRTSKTVNGVEHLYYRKAYVKIPILDHKLKIGIKGTLGSVGFSAELGLKTELSLGGGGGLLVEWE